MDGFMSVQKEKRDTDRRASERKKPEPFSLQGVLRRRATPSFESLDRKEESVASHLRESPENSREEES